MFWILYHCGEVDIKCFIQCLHALFYYSVDLQSCFLQVVDLHPTEEHLAM